MFFLSSLNLNWTCNLLNLNSCSSFYTVTASLFVLPVDSHSNQSLSLYTHSNSSLMYYTVVCKMTHVQPLILWIFDHRQMVELRWRCTVPVCRWRVVRHFRGSLKVSCRGTNHLCNLIILRRIPVFVDLVWASLCYWDCCRGYFGHVFEGSQTVTCDELVHRSDDAGEA